MSSVINLVVYPDQRLKTKSQTVTKFDDALKAKLDDLHQSTEFFDGIGIAGVQIGYMDRILYINHDGIVEFWNHKTGQSHPLKGGPLFMINPEIIEGSKETFVSDEACLSLPSVSAKVTRHNTVKAKYFDADGKEQVIETSIPLLAACIQHEIDHTNGITIAEYQSPLKRSMIIKKIEKYMSSRDVVTRFDPEHQCGTSCGHNH